MLAGEYDTGQRGNKPRPHEEWITGKRGKYNSAKARTRRQGNNKTWRDYGNHWTDCKDTNDC